MKPNIFIFTIDMEFPRVQFWVQHCSYYIPMIFHMWQILPSLRFDECYLTFVGMEKIFLIWLQLNLILNWLSTNKLHWIKKKNESLERSLEQVSEIELWMGNKKTIEVVRSKCLQSLFYKYFKMWYFFLGLYYLPKLIRGKRSEIISDFMYKELW